MKLQGNTGGDGTQAGQDGRGRDETRARILLAARDCFSRHGFDRTTVKLIASECGLTDAAIYYYFPSKRHLLEALWTIRANRGIRDIPANEPLTPERLQSLNNAVLDFFADNHQIMRLIFRCALDGDEVARALRNETRANWRRSLHEHLGTVAVGDVVQSEAEVLMAYLTGATMRAHMDSGDDFEGLARSAEFREELLDGCLLLLNVPLATAS